MYDLKALDRDAIPRALERAERYRLLNEPWQAESICRDILAADPDNQPALVALLLSLTDQFASDSSARSSEARLLVARLGDPYERAYYAGLVSERWANAALAGGAPGHVVFDWFADALAHFGEAERRSPRGNDDAVLRWNACVRMLRAHPDVKPHAGEELDAEVMDSLPPR